MVRRTLVSHLLVGGPVKDTGQNHLNHNNAVDMIENAITQIHQALDAFIEKRRADFLAQFDTLADRCITERSFHPLSDWITSGALRQVDAVCKPVLDQLPADLQVELRKLLNRDPDYSGTTIILRLEDEVEDILNGCIGGVEQRKIFWKKLSTEPPLMIRETFLNPFKTNFLTIRVKNSESVAGPENDLKMMDRLDKGEQDANFAHEQNRAAGDPFR